jgi:hypothetical protein
MRGASQRSFYLFEGLGINSQFSQSLLLRRSPHRRDFRFSIQRTNTANPVTERDYGLDGRHFRHSLFCRNYPLVRVSESHQQY